MATMLVHITVHEGREAEFEIFARRMYDASHATEPRLLRYEYWRGAEPRTYYTLSSFEDHRSFIEHQTSDHHETLGPGLRDVIESLRIEWVDPIEGATALPPTEHQDAEPDADDLTVRSTDRYAAEVPSWWRTMRTARE